MIQIDMDMPNACWECIFLYTQLGGDNKCELLSALERDCTIEEDVCIKRSEKCPLKRIETRNITDRNPNDRFNCEACGFMVCDWDAYGFEDETDERFSYDFAMKYCPNCGRKVEK